MAGGTAGDVLENLGGNIVKQDLVYQAMHQKRKLCGEWSVGLPGLLLGRQLG